MSGQRSIRRRVRYHADGVDIAADISAEIAVNVGRSGQTTTSHSTQRAAITQTSRAQANDDLDVTDDKEKR